MSTSPNQITSANAGKRLGFAGKSRVFLSQWRGAAQFVMRYRSSALLVAVVIAVCVSTAVFVRPARRVPQVYLLHLTSGVTSGGWTADASSWLTGNLLDGGQDFLTAEFEICNPDGSGILLPLDEIDVECLGPTGRWTATVARPHLAFDAFLGGELAVGVTTRRIRVLVPSETQRCKLAIRVRPLTAQERCREWLARSGFWRRFPKASAWFTGRLPRTKHWRQWRPEIELPRALIEHDPRKPDGPNRRQRPGWRSPVGKAGVRGPTAAVGHPGRSATDAYVQHSPRF